MKLIFIHGRAQEGKDPKKLKQQWTDSLKEGLSEQNLEIPDNIEIVFPYYGDLLYDLVQEIKQSGNLKDIIERGTINKQDAVFFHDFLLELAENANISSEEILMNYDEDIIEQGPLNWEWIQAILRALDKTPIGSLSLERFTYDVFVYCKFRAVSKRINELVSKEINNEPSVVVAHSLGSVVAYNVLRENPEWKISKFITVGSPLGVRSVQNSLKTPLSMPHCVQNGWFNAYDDRDVVALRALDDGVFPITPSIVNYGGVDNKTDNKHGIEGYLNDIKIAQQIFDSFNP